MWMWKLSFLCLNTCLHYPWVNILALKSLSAPRILNSRSDMFDWICHFHLFSRCSSACIVFLSACSYVHLSMAQTVRVPYPLVKCSFSFSKPILRSLTWPLWAPLYKMKCKVVDTITQITQINFFSIYATVIVPTRLHKSFFLQKCVAISLS